MEAARLVLVRYLPDEDRFCYEIKRDGTIIGGTYVQKPDFMRGIENRILELMGFSIRFLAERSSGDGPILVRHDPLWFLRVMSLVDRSKRLNDVVDLARNKKTGELFVMFEEIEDGPVCPWVDNSPKIVERFRGYMNQDVPFPD